MAASIGKIPGKVKSEKDNWFNSSVLHPPCQSIAEGIFDVTLPLGLHCDGGTNGGISPSSYYKWLLMVRVSLFNVPKQPQSEAPFQEPVVMEDALPALTLLHLLSLTRSQRWPEKPSRNTDRLRTRRGRTKGRGKGSGAPA